MMMNNVHNNKTINRLLETQEVGQNFLVINNNFHGQTINFPITDNLNRKSKEKKVLF